MLKSLSLPFHPQKAEGYCLAACAPMVLHYWGIAVDQNQLSERLGVIAGVGVPASRILRLTSSQITALYDSGEWETLTTWLNQGVPVIVMVQAGELSYWLDAEFPHALVLIGCDHSQVWLLDPAAVPEPISVSIDEFMLAWGELDFRYAILMPSEM